MPIIVPPPTPPARGAYPHGETITVIRAAEVADPYSGADTILDWDAATTHNIDDVAVAPRQSSEPTQDARNAVYTGLTLYLPAGADITRIDRVAVRGEVYEVDGDIAEWRSPFTGWAPGLEVNLSRVTG